MSRDVLGALGAGLAFIIGPGLMREAWGRRPPPPIVVASLAVASWTLYRALGPE